MRIKEKSEGKFGVKEGISIKTAAAAAAIIIV